MHEFEIIQSYFNTPVHRADLGVGDDAALFRIAANHQCVVTSDMLVSNRHFFADVDARTLGHKALAVNLSDLAAMGAEPIGFTLSLALPAVDEVWLSGFSGGLLALAQRFDCDLMGGDTTRSATDGLDALIINITAFGQVPVGQAIRRDGAQEGDDIWVSGSLGDAAFALSLMQRERSGEVLSSFEVECLAILRHRLEMPMPRLELGLALRGIASSMLDVSDGLAGDVRHILRASNMCADIDCDLLPISSPLKILNLQQQWRYAVTGGDDYELCFTANADKRGVVQQLSERIGLPLTCIGQITKCGTDVAHVNWCSKDADDLLHMSEWRGYNHFRS